MDAPLAGTIFEIRRFAIHDGPGIRTTVFLKGCPLDCWWCHNPEGRHPDAETFGLRRHEGTPQAREETAQAKIGYTITVDSVMEEVQKDEVFYDQSGGGVTFSGGEPMAQLQFLESLLRASKSRGIHTAVDTCGYATAADFERIYDFVNLFLFDLKLIDDEKHLNYTGVSNQLILSNLTLLAGKGNRIIVRIPMIPAITDTDENLRAVVDFLKPLKSIRQISLLPYNKLGEDKIDRYLMPRRRLHLEQQSQTELEQKASQLRNYGYDVKIGG